MVSKVRLGLSTPDEGRKTLRRNTATRAAAAALLLTAFAACGSDDDSESSNSAGATPDETPATVASDASEATAGPDETIGSAAATDAEWADIVAKANEEGEVLVYTHLSDPQMAALGEAFNEAYPEIEMTSVRLFGNDAFAKLQAERETGTDGADVFVDAGLAWVNGEVAEDPARVAPLVGPNVAALDPEWLVDGHTVVPMIGVNIFGWNTSLAPDGIATYEDLLKPEFKGRIGLPDLLAPAVGDFYYQMEQMMGVEYMEQLAAQEPVFYPGSTPLAQALASGEIAVTPYSNPNVTQALIDSGAPIEKTVPTGESKAWGASFTYTALGWAKHPNAAQVFVDFVTTVDGNVPVVANAVSTIESGLPDAVQSDPSEFNIFYGDPPPAEFEAHWREVFGR